MKIFTKVVALLLLTTLIASCSSSRRLMRISPFSEGEKEMASTDRSNAWPLYYHDSGSYSVLWPIVDLDDDGFAIRPIYNKEGDDQSILFPLSGWNTDDGDGWILTSYWDDDYNGIFPLYHHNSNDFSYYGPYWQDGESRGVFPLFGYGDDFRHVLNFYWESDSDSFDGGLFPLFHSDEDSTTIPLVYSYEKDDEDDYTHKLLMGILGHYDKNAEGSSSHFLPLWFANKDSNDYMSLFLPIYLNYGDNKSDNTHFLLWQQSEREDKSVKALYPLYYQQVVGSEKMVVTPLFGYSHDTSGENDFLSIMGPIYINREKGDVYYRSVLWPLYVSEGDSNYTHKKIFPFYNCYREDDLVRRRFLLGLGKYQVDDNGTKFRVWPLCNYSSDGNGVENVIDYTLYQHHTDDKGTFKNSIFPLYYVDNDSNSYDYSTLLYLFRRYGDLEDGKKSNAATRLWPLFAVRDKCFDADFFLFSKYGDAQRSGWSIFGNFIYSYDRREYADSNMATSHNYLLFGSHKKRLYPEDNIPNSLNSSYQETIKTVDSRFLLWGAEEKHFKIWQDGALTLTESWIIDRWLYKNDFTHLSNSSSSSTSFRKSGLSVIDLDKRNSLYKGGSDLQLLEAVKNILTAKNITCKSDSDADILAALKVLAKQNSRVKVEEGNHVWPFYEYASSEDDYDFKILFGLVSSKRSGEHSKTSVLKYLYRSETDGKSTRRDIFPFISIDSGENGGFSFLGKFLNLRKGNNGRYGNILFIPWGSKPNK